MYVKCTCTHFQRHPKNTCVNNIRRLQRINLCTYLFICVDYRANKRNTTISCSSSTPTAAAATCRRCQTC